MEKKYKLAIIINAIDKASGTLGGLGKAVGGLGKIAAGLGVTALAGVTALGIGLGNLALQAAPLEGITASFQNMAQVGERSADDLLVAMREASNKTIRDAELMRQTNIALTGAGEELGKEFGDKLPKLLEVARASARATGQSAEFMFQSLVTGIKRTSPMLIDNTGLQLKLGAANEALAAQLGKTVEELSAEEQQIALLNATVEAGQGLIESVGLEGMSSSEQLAQLSATIGNLKDKLGTAFLPVLVRLAGLLSDLADRYGPKIVEFAETVGENLAGLIDEMATAMEGEGVQGGLQILLDKITGWLDENWPVIQEQLKTWAKMFWDWIENDAVPVAKEKLDALTVAIREWSEDPGTQAKLAEIGETAGRGLVEGVRALIGVAETWTPIIVEFTGALAEASSEAALPALKEIARGLATGFVTGFSEALNIKLSESLKGAIARVGMLALPGGVGLGGGLPGFQFGGVVPGLAGQPRLAMVHGGETITPPGGRGGGGGGRMVVEHLCPDCLRRTVDEQMNRNLERAGGPAWRR